MNDKPGLPREFWFGMINAIVIMMIIYIAIWGIS
jgi:hypothetical protein